MREQRLISTSHLSVAFDFFASTISSLLCQHCQQILKFVLVQLLVIIVRHQGFCGLIFLSNVCLVDQVQVIVVVEKLQ